MLIDEQSNTYSITFVDTEIEPNKGKILDIGAIKADGNHYHKTSLVDFTQFLKGSRYVCGHNILKHDIKYLGKAVYDAGIDPSNIIDTLYLLVINALETVKFMGQNTKENEAIDIMAMAQTYQDSIELSNDTINNKVMNEKNFDYLKEQVKYTGFGEGLENDLKEKMQQQEPSFKLYHNAHYGNDVAVATLNFKKSEQSDMYFFNSYQVNLQKEHGKEIMEQTFYINKGNNITMKEAYNLMEGRAVNKDLTNKQGQVYNSWLQFDFKDADTNGNFKLKQ